MEMAKGGPGEQCLQGPASAGGKVLLGPSDPNSDQQLCNLHPQSGSLRASPTPRQKGSLQGLMPLVKGKGLTDAPRANELPQPRSRKMLSSR